MEYRAVSTKLPNNEFTMFRQFCEKKGVTPASLIRDLILHEIKITVPHTIAGKNKIHYNKKTDSFCWSIELDNGEQIGILKNVSPAFIDELHEIITLSLGERYAFIHKTEKDSIAVPNGILRGKSK